MSRNMRVAATRVARYRLTGRRAIFEAAQTLFALQGYPATSLAQIAEVVGLRTGSLYNHIESKQELLVRIVAGANDVLRRESYGAFQASRPPAEALRAAAFGHAYAHATHPWEMLILGQDLASVEGPLPTRVRDGQDRYRAGLVRLLRHGQEDGVFDAAPPDAVADLILGVGPVVARKAMSAPLAAPEELAEIHAELALRLVGAEPCA